MNSVSNEDPSGAQSRRGRSLRREFRTEYKVKFRPFSNYEYVDGHFVPSPGTTATSDARQPPTVTTNPPGEGAHPWYSEVVELRKQANEFRVQFHSCGKQVGVSIFKHGLIPFIVPRLGN